MGETYEGTIKSVMPYGVFVEFMPGKEGLLHISEWDWKYFGNIEETGAAEGQKLQVKLLEVDPKTGKFRLSRRALIEKPEGYEEQSERPRERRRGREERDGEGRRGERRRNPRREERNSDDSDSEEQRPSDEERPRHQERRRNPRREERNEEPRREEREEEPKREPKSSEDKPGSPADFFKQFGQF